MDSRLLKDVIPELSHEISALLIREGEDELAEQVATLEIIDRCRCGDESCSTIYTLPRLIGKWQGEYETVDLRPVKGMITIFLHDRQISQVEILFREEIRHRLVQLLPDNEWSASDNRMVKR